MRAAVRPGVALHGQPAALRLAASGRAGLHLRAAAPARLGALASLRTAALSAAAATVQRAASSSLAAAATVSACAAAVPPSCTPGAAPQLTAHNSLTGSASPLVPASASSKGSLSWYSCGPTVYDAAHLGHARTYVALDVLRRVTEAALPPGVRLQYAMGVTDIDDKIVATASGEAGTRATSSWPPSEAELDAARAAAAAVARRWESAFFLDLALLGVAPPTTVVRVTEHLPDILAFVEALQDGGLAYLIPGDGVYFDIAAFTAGGSSYGKLGPAAASGTPPPPGLGGSHSQRAAAKRDPRDFALWKLLAQPAPEQAPASLPVAWPSRWGLGRPGWHIECSAMTRAVFGDTLDVHAGGIDLAFPHHCNELAQSEGRLLVEEHAAGCCGSAPAPAAGLSGSPWCPLWLHTGHVHIEGRKMSKSLKNFISIQAALAEGAAAGDIAGALLASLGGAVGYSRVQAAADAFRGWVVSTHYRSDVTYSPGRLAGAAATLAGLIKAVAGVAAAANEPAVAAAWCADLRGGQGGAAAAAAGSVGRQADAALRSATDAFIVASNRALLQDFDTPTAYKAACTLAAALAASTPPAAAAAPASAFAAASALVAFLQRAGFWVAAPLEAQLASASAALHVSAGAGLWAAAAQRGTGKGPSIVAVADEAGSCTGVSAPPGAASESLLALGGSAADFRATVRGAAKELGTAAKAAAKTAKAAGEAPSELSQQVAAAASRLLTAADALRDVGFPAAGLKLVDGPGGAPQVTPAPPP